MTIHRPVLLKETIDLLNLKPGMTVIDATLGGGGHSIEIMKEILPSGELIAIDQDRSAIEKFRENLDSLKLGLKKENLNLINDNFANLKNIVSGLETSQADAIVADLGISSDQLKDPNRGFSFQKDAPLDMRMNLGSELTARDVINNYPEEKLATILKNYGDERYAKNIAHQIVKVRTSDPIVSTRRLVQTIEESVPRKYLHNKIHFATRTFQALRIEVNQELENLEKFLSQAVEVLKTRGKLAVISFHSGEDRIVKNFFRANARGSISAPEKLIYGNVGEPVLKIITKKPVTPTEVEKENNPRSRSAKLRVAKKL